MTSTTTVRELFVSSDRAGVAALVRLPPVPTGLAQMVTGFEWSGLAERVFDLLDLNLVDILLAGWRTNDEVRRELRATADDPSRQVLVHLASHTLDSTHAPSIELRAQGRKLMELVFPIELAFDIEAVELMIRTGAVREVRTGQVKVRGTVKLESTVILERQLAPIALLGRIVLGTQAPAASATLLSPLAAGV